MARRGMASALISSLIFSRNRPAQLDALLMSLERNAPGVFDITVLWRSTSPEFYRGYLRLLEINSYASILEHEGDFRTDVMRYLPERGPVVFFTDDSILYRPLPSIPDVFGADLAAFSLRLGANTTRCYPHNRDQRVPDQFETLWWPDEAANQTAMWDWREADGDFGYPASLDGHIMLATDVRHMIGNQGFTNPNTLEDVLAFHARGRLPHALAAFGQSCLVGIPANRVADTHDTNRAGDLSSYSIETLNSLFLDGYRVNIDAMDWTLVDGAHSEIPLVLEKELA